MLINDILDGAAMRPASCVPMDTPLLEAAGLLKHLDCTALIVTMNGRIVGTCSDHEMVGAIAQHGAAIGLLTVGDVMHRARLTCTMTDDISDTLDRMSAAGVHHVCVLKDGEPLTVLSARQFESACRFLKVQADTDELTGLSNRRSFLKAVDAELNRHRRHRTPLAVAMIDIDHFKKINDQLGHAEGDLLLKRTAQLLAGGIRSFDEVARIGGDEFAILFPESRLSEAVDACRRLLTACSQQDLPRLNGVFCVSVSIGVTVARSSDADVESILARADESLYRAKATGRGRVVAARTSNANAAGRPLSLSA